MMSEILQSAIIISILASTIRIATPLLLASIGELVTEKAGILNLGVEGTMLMGAFIGFLAAYSTGSPAIALLTAMAAGGLVSFIMAFMSATLKVDQVVTGMAINLLGSGISFFWYRSAFPDFSISEADLPTISVMQNINIPFLSDIPYLGPILFSQRLLTYIAFLAVPLVWFFLYRTKYGLLIRGLGENPRALDMKGVNVIKLQYLAAIFGGMMAALGGTFLTLGSTVRYFPEITAGRGWLAIVIVIAGNWQPSRILVATILFALLDAFQLQLQGLGVLIPYQVLLALPYICAIVAMMGGRLRSVAPKQLGIPYERE
jgi:simple sugar transport system permease protein